MQNPRTKNYFIFEKKVTCHGMKKKWRKARVEGGGVVGEAERRSGAGSQFSHSRRVFAPLNRQKLKLCERRNHQFQSEIFSWTNSKI